MGKKINVGPAVKREVRTIKHFESLYENARFAVQYLIKSRSEITQTLTENTKLVKQDAVLVCFSNYFVPNENYTLIFTRSKSCNTD